MLGRVIRVSLPPAALALVLGILARTPGWTAADLRADRVIWTLRTPWLTAVAQVLNVAFRPSSALVVLALLVAALLVLGRPRTAAFTGLVVGAGWTASTIVKHVIARPRPPAAHALLPQFGADGYPSGHVSITLSFAIAAALLAQGTRAFRAVVTTGAVVVPAQMFARMYLGAHYPTDTVGSLLVVTAAAYAVIVYREQIERAAARVLPAASPRAGGGPEAGGGQM